MADYYKWNNIYVPGWPGCGNGGLQVSDVKRCLEVIFDDRFIIVEHKMKEKNSGNS